VLEIILSIILIITLILSSIIVVKKRKKAGLTGVKSVLTSICFFLIAIISLFAYWFNFMGLLVWFINICLLILGAYFTKYMKIEEK